MTNYYDKVLDYIETDCTKELELYGFELADRRRLPEMIDATFTYELKDEHWIALLYIDANQYGYEPSFCRINFRLWIKQWQGAGSESNLIFEENLKGLEPENKKLLVSFKNYFNKVLKFLEED